MYFDILYYMKHGAKIQNVLKFWQKICYFVKGILMKIFFFAKDVDIYIVILNIFLLLFESLFKKCRKCIENVNIFSSPL